MTQQAFLQHLGIVLTLLLCAGINFSLKLYGIAWVLFFSAIGGVIVTAVRLGWVSIPGVT